VSDFYEYFIYGVRSVYHTMCQKIIYLTVRNNVFYFNIRVPLEIQFRLNKTKIITSLNTKSLIKAQKLSYTISDWLERY